MSTGTEMKFTADEIPDPMNRKVLSLMVGVAMMLIMIFLKHMNAM